MKTLKNCLYILIVLMFASSCVKDEGNYDYVDLPEVDLSQIPNTANGIIGERLFIEGDFQTTLSEADLSFSWGIRLQDENYDYYMDTISKEKDLDVVINLAPGERDLLYTVVDKKHRVRYDREIHLNVNTPFSKGWAMLKEKNGGTEFDFISNTTNTHYENILANVTGVSFEGKPVNLEFYWNKYTPFSSMLIVTEYDGAFFDAFSMQINKTIEERFRSMNAVNLPFSGSFINKLTNLTACFVAGGTVFGKGGVDIDDNAWWEVPASGDYYVRNVGATIYSGLVFFDEKNRRYIKMERDSYSSDVYSLVGFSANDPANAAFDPADLQKDCLWMETTALTYQWTEPVIAVLKDDVGEFFIQKFYCDYATGFNAQLELSVDTGNLDDNSVFANNPILPFTYLSKGNVIHRFNRTTDAVEYNHLVVEAAIEAMAVSYDGSILGVAVANGTGSKIIFYDLNNSNAILDTYTTDSKVFKLKYKEDI